MSRNKPAPTIWWMHPAVPFAAASGLVAIAAILLPGSVYEKSWQTPKYFTGEFFRFVLLCISAFVLGTLIGTRQPGQRDPSSQPYWAEQISWQTARRLFNISFVLCLIGYICWAGAAISRGISLDLVLGAFTGQKGATYVLRDEYLPTVSGVTTLTQFGIAAVILGVPLGFARGWRGVRGKLALVIGLAAIRVTLNSERLAAIELVCPLIILWVHLRYTDSRRGRAGLPRLIRWAPALGAVAIFCLFTAAEYSRSWVTFYRDRGGDQNLVGFAGQRLLGYYATALNNGSLLLERVDYPLGTPFFTAHFMWRFPILGTYIENYYSNLMLNDQEHYMSLLDRGANPEFNNPDGILLPILDFGLAGGLLYWLLAGVVVGVAYRSFLAKSAAGLCWFPPLFVGLIESPRILYWADGRFFPAACMLLLASVWLGRHPRRLPYIAPQEVQQASSAST